MMYRISEFTTQEAIRDYELSKWIFGLLAFCALLLDPMFVSIALETDEVKLKWVAWIATLFFTLLALLWLYLFLLAKSRIIWLPSKRRKNNI